MAEQAPKTLWDSPTMAKMLELGEEITGPYARHMITQSGLPRQAASADKLVVLDNACGTAIVTRNLQEGDLLDAGAKSKLEVTCADFAEAMVNAAQNQATKSGWKNTTVTQADAMDTKLPSSKFTYIFFNFGPFLIPRPYQSIQECLRMLQPGGTVGVTCWMEVPWLDDYRPAFEKNPDFPPYPSDISFIKRLTETGEPWYTPGDVKHHLEVNGFVDVEAKTYETDTAFTLEQIRSVLPGTLGITQAKLWTPEQRMKYPGPVEEAVMKHLHEKYPDGIVKWHWKAIVGTGRKPT